MTRAEPLRLTFPVPPASNRYWRMGGGRLYKSQAAREYQEVMGERLRELGLTVIRRPVRLWVDLTWYRDRQAGDLDGRTKVILDAMQGYVYENDSQIRKLTAELVEVPKGQGRMDVTVQVHQPKEA